jgi:hypothetical protein
VRPTLPRSFRAHASHLRRQFLQGGGLPFADVLAGGRARPGPGPTAGPARASRAACAAGRALDGKAEREWLWKGRRAYLVDGTAVSVPGTPAIQAAYPLVHVQGPGQGFPVGRLGGPRLPGRRGGREPGVRPVRR